MSKSYLQTTFISLINSKWAIVIILLGFAIVVGLYSWRTPPFEGSDEPQHFAYIEWFSAGKGFPPQGEAAWDTPVRQEASQPPLYYLLASIPTNLVNKGVVDAEYRPNPHFPSNAPGIRPDNKNVAIHYPADTSPLRGGWLALYLARGVSLLFGGLLLVSVYGLASQVTPGRPAFALAATLLVALIPQVLYVSSVVSNDIAAAATGALTLWLLALLVNKGALRWLGLALGGAFGLAVLSKVSAFALAIPIAAALAYIWWSDKSSRRRLMGTAAAFLFGALLVGGWWYVRTWITYGSPLGLGTHYEAPWAVAALGDRIAPTRAWLEVFYSFWAAFGAGNIKFPGWTYGLMAALVLLAIAGLVMSGWRWWRTDRRLNDKPVLILLLILAVVAVSVALELWMQRVTAPHGRLLFPALGAIVVLLVSGWWAVRPWIVTVGLAVLLLLAILSLPLLLEPAYALPPALSEAQLSAIVGVQDNRWRFGDAAELRGVLLEESSVMAGDELPLTACWQTIGPTEADYSILIHLVGPDNIIVAKRLTYPGLGSYPTSVWEADHLFCDQIVIEIPGELPRTLLYQVEIGLLNTQTGKRLPAYGQNGEELTQTFVETIRLQALKPAALAQPPAGEGPIRLLSADYPDLWQAGAENRVTLEWWSGSKMDLDYTVFIHLRDGSNGENVAQGDGPPVDGWYPTSAWAAGEVVEDSHTFTLPAGMQQGAYDLVAGWYDRESGLRFGEEQLLGTVEVVP